MKWEITNPSDYCTVESGCFIVACVATIIIGRGKYGLTPIGDTDEKYEMPIFLFGGFDEFFNQEFGYKDLEEAVKTVKEKRKSELISCLNSVSLAPGKERTSMNDICGRAHSIALALTGPEA